MSEILDKFINDKNSDWIFDDNIKMKIKSEFLFNNKIIKNKLYEWFMDIYNKVKPICIDETIDIVIRSPTHDIVKTLVNH